MEDQYTINNEAELEAVIGTPMEFVKAKVLTQLDDVMREFIRKSPLVFISTIDANGHVDVSPKATLAVSSTSTQRAACSSQTVRETG